MIVHRRVFALLAVLWTGTNAAHLAQQMASGSQGLATIASPDCWLKAANALDRSLGSGMDTSSCTWLTSFHQKVLALELARCHVTDMGRPLFVTEDGFNDCSIQNYDQNLPDCLTRLSDSGTNAYTHFFLHANELCTRLLREVEADQHYETSRQLAKTSEMAQLGLQRMMLQQQELSQDWKHQGEESKRLHEQLRIEIGEQSILVTNSATHLQSFLHDQQEEWLEVQQDLHRSQAQELESQHNELQRQREELYRLSETIRKAEQSIQPWSIGLDVMMEQALKGYSLLRSALFTFGTILVIWFLTLPKIFQWIRRYMMGLALVVEFVDVIVLLTSNDGWLTNLQQKQTRANLQSIVVPAEFLIYLIGAGLSIVGMCLSWCRRPKSSDDYAEPKESTSEFVATEQELPSSSCSIQFVLNRQEEVLRTFESYEAAWNQRLSHASSLTTPPNVMAPPPSWNATNNNATHASEGPLIVVSPDASRMKQQESNVDDTTNVSSILLSSSNSQYPLLYPVAIASTSSVAPSPSTACTAITELTTGSRDDQENNFLQMTAMMVEEEESNNEVVTMGHTTYSPPDDVEMANVPVVDSAKPLDKKRPISAVLSGKEQHQDGGEEPSAKRSRGDYGMEL